MPALRVYLENAEQETDMGEHARELFLARMKTLTDSQLTLAVNYYKANSNSTSKAWKAGNEIAYACASKELYFRRHSQDEREARQIQLAQRESEIRHDRDREQALDRQATHQALQFMARKAHAQAEIEVREEVTKEEQEKKNTLREDLKRTSSLRKRYYIIGAGIFGAGLFFTFLINPTKPAAASGILATSMVTAAIFFVVGYLRSRVAPLTVPEHAIEERIQTRAIKLLADFQYANKHKIDLAKKEDQRIETLRRSRKKQLISVQKTQQTRSPEVTEDGFADQHSQDELFETFTKSNPNSVEGLSFDDVSGTLNTEDQKAEQTERNDGHASGNSKAHNNAFN